MQSCLGMYIEENLIKYAKVQKDRDNIKIEAFGTKFYENIEQAINQIVLETNSTRVPISINVSEEKYDYFQVFALLNKQALKKSMDIEFEMLCRERGLQNDLMDKRYTFVLNQENPEKMKAIHVSVEKNKLERTKNLFTKYNLSTVEPLPTSIMNLITANPTKNELIVNMEECTYLTFLENGQISNVEKLNTSIVEVLNEISKVENSQTKAYEILKNTTITTQETDSIQEGNEYLNVVVPVLFKILNEIKGKIALFGKKVHKIYFSGTGIVINNVDMYFQDRLNDIQCEILKPSFVDSQSLKIGIKDYIEVNSAISMALNGLGIGTTNDLNFGNKGALTTAKTGLNGITQGKSNKKLDAFEKLTIRLSILCVAFIIGYGVFSNNLMTGMEDKIRNTDSKIKETQGYIDEMAENQESIEYLSAEYEAIIARLNNETVTNEDVAFRERELPNFLTKLATTIPTEVKLVSVENTENRHIVIQARAIKYQQLGYFQAILRVNNILSDISASTGVRYYDEHTGEEYILVTIEGDLV